MELKRVIAKDSKRAMEEVTRLYGSDTLVLSAQRRAGQFEIVVAQDLKPDSSLVHQGNREYVVESRDSDPLGSTFSTILHGDRRSKNRNNLSADRALEIVESFKDEIRLLKNEISEGQKTSAWLIKQLQNNGLNSWQQNVLDIQAPQRLKTLLIDALAQVENSDEGKKHVAELLSESIAVATEDPADITGKHAFFGSSGVGKTSLIAKLANMASNKIGTDAVCVVSFADGKVGSWTQVQTIAAKLGIDCYRAKTQTSMAEMIPELKKYECILIDTSAADISKTYSDITQIAPDCLSHLIVDANSGRSSLNNLFEGEISWDTISVSKLDESQEYWILIDKLIKQLDSPLWLMSDTSDLKTPAKLMDPHSFVLNQISDLFSRGTSGLSKEHNMGRQDDSTTTTLDYLNEMNKVSNLSSNLKLTH